MTPGCRTPAASPPDRRRDAGRRPGWPQVRPHYWNSLLLPMMVLHRKVVARSPERRSDVAQFPPWLDRSLHAVTRLERSLLASGFPFPAGGSVLATALRP